jgi:hypothetical protein
MSKSRRILRVGYVARIGGMRNAYTLLVARLEVKKTLENPRRRSKDNIKMTFRKIEISFALNFPFCVSDPL